MNESIYYIVDDIHRAILENKKISFEYMKWNVSKKMEKRKEGLYKVSPWALTWDDENYYLIAFDEEAGKIKHYRVDKMKSIKIVEEKREGRAEFREFNLAEYAKMSFGMYGGEKTHVVIAFKEEMVGVLLDRFGTGIPIKKAKKAGWYETDVEVAVSDQFLGWIFALGDGVKITEPSRVVKQMKEKLKNIGDLY